MSAEGPVGSQASGQSEPAGSAEPAESAREALRLLVGRAATLAVAESLTGGLVAAELAAVPGASRAFRGSVTAYATELKHEILGVDAALLAERGAVDPDVARGMAEGVRHRLGADWGVATTGVAGPTPRTVSRSARSSSPSPARRAPWSSRCGSPGTAARSAGRRWRLSWNCSPPNCGGVRLRVRSPPRPRPKDSGTARAERPHVTVPVRLPAAKDREEDGGSDVCSPE